jgi:hypothetical protein
MRDAGRYDMTGRQEGFSAMPSTDVHSSHEANVPHYPGHYLLAVIDSQQEADTAAQALQDAGFAHDDISVFHGAEGLKLFEAQEESAGLPTKMLHAFLDIEGGVVRQRFSDALRQGASDVCVHLRDSDHLQQQRAEEILRQRHGYLLTMLGPFTWEERPSS